MKRSELYQSSYQRLYQDPHLVIPGFFGLINGYWHKLKFFVLRKKVVIGTMLRVYGKFRIMGSGHVIMGNNCVVQSKLFKATTFMTTNPKATIRIGDNATFNGTTIQCFDEVTIGNYCSIADGYIVDSISHYLSADRRFLPARGLETSPVRLEKNVWVSAKVMICHGVTIGQNSVIGAFSLVRKPVPDNSFYAGAPAQFIKRIPPTHEPVEKVKA